MLRVDVGDIYAQYVPSDLKHAWPEYVVIDDVIGDKIEFTIYSMIFDQLTTSKGEGNLQQLLDGLKDGDIEKVDESTLHSFICLCKLLEA